MHVAAYLGDVTVGRLTGAVEITIQKGSIDIGEAVPTRSCCAPRWAT